MVVACLCRINNANCRCSIFNNYGKSYKKFRIMKPDDFTIFANISLISWGLSGIIMSILFFREVFADKKHKFWVIVAHFLAISGLISIIIFVVELWLLLDRPPMRTLGETRLWYSIFLVLVSYLVYLKWKYKALFVSGIMFGVLFLLINMLHPEALNKNLPPALQSAWFIPHVVVYMIAYALLGMSWLVAIFGLLPYFRKQWKGRETVIADNLVYIGFGFLTLGLVFGALWAKEAWGNYWTWDPKETWAMITWFAYMLYIHYRFRHNKNKITALLILFFAFILLIICWLGMQYLSVGANSVHTY
ncbi:MAG: cytochrome c biogenesis protein CcsA [Bacteroidales bacterium]|nr:cytochrome c biogenesis protein CcsA [Bacteroidales bacterium]